MAHYHGVGGGNFRVLNCIESTGEQYIDTRFIPTSTTKIVIKAKAESNHFYVATNSQNPRFGIYLLTSATVDFACGTTGYVSSTITGVSMPATVTMENGYLTVNGKVHTFAEQSEFVCNSTLWLFRGNGTNNGGGTLYACQIYDNGTLVRDYIPCINPDGVAGLFDKVNHQFYANAGTGTFTVGEATGEIISTTVGVAREVIKRYHEVDVVYRKVKKAYHEVNGVGRLYFKEGTPIGELDVGSSVFMDVGGIPTEFLVAYQGNPDDTLYSIPNLGTWIAMKDCYKEMLYSQGVSNTNSTSAACYETSLVHSYLNNEFLSLIDDNVQKKIQTVKIPYAYRQYGYWYLGKGDSGLSTKIFIFSVAEIGGFNWSDPDCEEEGIWIAPSLDFRYAYYNGNAVAQWTRSPTTRASSVHNVYAVDDDGSLTRVASATATRYIRPVLILQSETLVDSDFNVIA